MGVAISGGDLGVASLFSLPFNWFQRWNVIRLKAKLTKVRTKALSVLAFWHKRQLFLFRCEESKKTPAEMIGATVITDTDRINRGQEKKTNRAFSFSFISPSFPWVLIIWSARLSGVWICSLEFLQALEARDVPQRWRGWRGWCQKWRFPPIS